MTPRASLPFDGLVKLYDETRTFDARCFEAALDFLAERFPVGSHPAVFERRTGPGITGQTKLTQESQFHLKLPGYFSLYAVTFQFIS